MTTERADLREGRAALARGDWADAYRALLGADQASLTGSDLEGLADAAWWTSHLEESIAYRNKAYAAFVQEGDDYHAAAVAARLCIEYSVRGDVSVGSGFLMKARRHAEGFPDDVGQGFLAMVEANVARFTGDIERALTLARRATEIGESSGDRDLVAMSLETEGLALIELGRVHEGLALLDEAMTAVLSGELTPYFTGIIYCSLIEACLGLSDLRRAGEWSDAARTWCDSLPADAPFPAMCRVNRAEVAWLRGEWHQAEAEATRACEEMERVEPHAAGPAFYQVGEIRRRLGDVAGAERAYVRAHELGRDPQPGIALLRLAQGKVDAARTALRLALEAPSDLPRRVSLFAAQAEAALAAHDLEEAGRAAEGLERIAAESPTPAYEAVAADARGAVLLAATDASAALGSLRRACTIWRELRLPYETARTRVAVARALRLAGAEEDARLELTAALATFERLGAQPDVAATARLLGGRPKLAAGLTAREAEVLRHVAAGKTNRDIAVELVISEHTVARHLQNIFAKTGVTSRSAATAFAFEHDLA